MKLNIVTDSRIDADAIFQVIAHPTIEGFYGVYDTEFHAVEFDSFDREEAVQYAVHANDVISGIIDLFGN